MIRINKYLCLFLNNKIEFFQYYILCLSIIYNIRYVLCNNDIFRYRRRKEQKYNKDHRDHIKISYVNQLLYDNSQW